MTEPNTPTTDDSPTKSKRARKPSPDPTLAPNPTLAPSPFDGTIAHGAVLVDSRANVAHVTLTKPTSELIDDLYHALFGWYRPDDTPTPP